MTAKTMMILVILVINWMKMSMKIFCFLQIRVVQQGNQRKSGFVAPQVTFPPIRSNITVAKIWGIQGGLVEKGFELQFRRIDGLMVVSSR